MLRLNEILVNNLNAQLEMLSPAQLQRQQEALKGLRQRNEEAVEKQVQEALTAAQKEGPGKRSKPAESTVG